jgi:hypothetical protein
VAVFVGRLAPVLVESLSDFVKFVRRGVRDLIWFAFLAVGDWHGRAVSVRLLEAVRRGREDREEVGGYGPVALPSPRPVDG